MSVCTDETEIGFEKVRENSRECHNHKLQSFLDEETDKAKQVQLEQTHEKHYD